MIRHDLWYMIRKFGYDQGDITTHPEIHQKKKMWIGSILLTDTYSFFYSSNISLFRKSEYSNFETIRTLDMSRLVVMQHQGRFRGWQTAWILWFMEKQSFTDIKGVQNKGKCVFQIETLPLNININELWNAHNDKKRMSGMDIWV